MTTELSARIDPAIVARVLLSGDLRQLTDVQKVSYYNRVCDSLGLNPLTQPFAYTILQGKEILYARKECTEQLRRLHAITVQIVSRDVVEGCYVVQARALLSVGDRSDDSIGAVAIDGLKGQARADAMMKAETKAKRRVTLSICGLGMLDESELVDLTPADAPPTHNDIMRGETPAPLSPVGETLRQALREAPRPAAPASGKSLDEALAPPVQAGDIVVRVLDLLPPPSRSDAKGHVRISGRQDTLPFYSVKVEQQLKDAQAAGVAVRLDLQTAKHTGQLYVKGVSEADPF